MLHVLWHMPCGTGMHITNASVQSQQKCEVQLCVDPSKKRDFLMLSNVAVSDCAEDFRRDWLADL